MSDEPELMTIRQAREKNIRKVRAPEWADEYLEIPLLGDGAVGMWYTMHFPKMRGVPGMESLVCQQIFYTAIDEDVPWAVAYDPEGLGNDGC